MLPRHPRHVSAADADKKMDLRQLEMIVEVARHGSFTAAAQNLNIAQSSVSRRIQRAEVELGVELFARRARPVTLTEAGTRLVAGGTDLLRQMDEIEADVRSYASIVRGRLALGLGSLAFSMEALPKLIARFRQEYPRVELAIHDEHDQREINDALAAAKLDIAITGTFPENIGPEHAVEQLFTSELVLLVPGGHELATRQTVALSTLREELFVFPPSSLARESFVRACRNCGFTPRIPIECVQGTTLLSAVEHGVGLTAISRLNGPAMDPPWGLRWVSLDPSPPSPSIVFQWQRERPLNGPAQAFLDFAHRNLATVAEAALCDVMTPVALESP